MRLLFAGTPTTALPTLSALVAAGHDVAAVLTRPPARSGRGRQLRPSPVAELASELGLEVRTDDPRSPEFRQWLQASGVEACPVVAYGALLPGSVLTVPKFGWINLHFSVLPRWRGAAPVQRGIIAGDDQVGATTFEVTVPLDSGPVYLTYAEPLGELATASEVLNHLAQVGAGMMVETLKLAAQGVSPTPQPDSGVSIAPKLSVEGAQIDWNRPATEIHNHVRGHSDDPGAWTLYGGQRLKVLRTAPSAEGGLEAGQLRVQRRAVHVGTGSDALELVEVQPVGKRVMPAADWARGGVPDGTVLG